MPLKLVYKSKMENFDTKRRDDQDVKNCINNIRRKMLNKEGDNNKTSSENCETKELENEVEESLKKKNVDFFSKGSHIADGENFQSLAAWSKDGFHNADMIKFKIHPILKLFDPQIMDVKRITDPHGNPIGRHKVYWAISVTLNLDHLGPPVTKNLDQELKTASEIFSVCFWSIFLQASSLQFGPPLDPPIY